MKDNFLFYEINSEMSRIDEKEIDSILDSMDEFDSDISTEDYNFGLI